MTAEKYRDNVCSVIRKKSGNSVCIFHRKNFPPDAGWQFPQGGIDPQKELISELKRELREEIGTDAVIVTAISPQIYYYDFPEDIPLKQKGFKGQKQQWVLVEPFDDSIQFVFLGENAEFDSYQWVTAQEALRRIVSFKIDVYKKALQDLNLL